MTKRPVCHAGLFFKGDDILENLILHTIKIDCCEADNITIA